MKTLLFTGRVTSSDKEPLFCCEEIEITAKKIVFQNYPLSLLKVALDKDGITVEGVRYQWHMLPITISKSGKHATVYREIVEENITITVECKSANREDEL